MIKWSLLLFAAFATGFVLAAATSSDRAAKLEVEIARLNSKISDLNQAAAKRAVPSLINSSDPHFAPRSEITPRFKKGSMGCGSSPEFLYPYLTLHQNLVALNIAETNCERIELSTKAIALDETYLVNFQNGNTTYLLQAIRIGEIDYYVDATDWRLLNDTKAEKDNTDANR